jgi:hypothetical protein
MSTTEMQRAPAVIKLRPLNGALSGTLERGRAQAVTGNRPCRCSCDHLGDLIGRHVHPFLWAVVISAHTTWASRKRRRRWAGALHNLGAAKIQLWRATGWGPRLVGPRE